MSEILIKDLPTEERPRERFIEYGANALSTTELLAIIIRTGSKNQSAINLAKSILQKTEGIKSLNDISLNQLTEISGIGPSKAVQIMASIELGKRVSQSLIGKENELKRIKTPKDCYDLLGNEMRYLKQEHFIVLSLDAQKRLIARDTVYIGAVDATFSHPREIFNIAVRRLATEIICIHNHPTGDPTPSKQDLLMTNLIIEAGNMMKIPLFDHIIIGRDDYRSIRACIEFEKGLKKKSN